jgi:hypothetical protein
MDNLANLPLADLVLATGTLGLAASGVVEGLKSYDRVGLKGYKCIRETLGDSLMSTMRFAYGDNYEVLLKAQYRNVEGKEELVSSLRQGIRLGLKPDNAIEVAKDVGVVLPDQLLEITNQLVKGKELTDEQTGLLGRFELAIDTKIDAAITLAESTYQASMRNHAFFVSIVIAIVAAIGLAETPINMFTSKEGILSISKKISWSLVFIVGIAAVPLAPIAKDLSTGLRAAATALRSRK